MMSPLANRTFRRLFTAQVIALAGTGLSTIALALLAYDLAGGDAGVVLGTALALKMVAYVGIAPIVGGLAHHLPRRRLLIALDVARAGGVLVGAGLLLGLTKPGLLALLPIWVVLGAGSSLIQTPAGRLLKRSANEGDRPAIYAAQFALSHACWLLAYLLAGWIGGSFSLATAFTVLALIALTATAVAVVLWPANDLSEIEHVHEPIIHEHLHIHDGHHQHPHDDWEGPEPHRHPHRHSALKHKHPYVIDLHHPMWPAR